MNCHDVQSSFSLYLYGELDFAREEALENHLAECAFCQIGLAREKQWHTLSNSQVQEPPLDLLADCRQQLRPALAREKANPTARPSWWRFTNPFHISATRWSAQIALASMLLFVGFATARWLDRNSLRSNTNQMSLLGATANSGFDPAKASIRDIQADGGGLVRIVVNQESEITGRIDDPNIRNLLLAGTHQPDPGVRFYSFEVLTRVGASRSANDLRDVVFSAVRNDPNPAVRLEAVEGIRQFLSDPSALEALTFVLEHDDDPGVRSAAMDVLVPNEDGASVTPATAQAIQEVIHSSTGDDYIRARCTQVLHEAKLPIIY
jgi:hypothetical protein